MKLPQFVPILTAFTERVSGLEMVELLKSPSALARALADTQKVVGHDGVLNIFDPFLLSSACIRKRNGVNSPGETQCKGLVPAEEITQTAPLAALLESIQPLRHHLPESAMIFATFSGPGLLHSQLQDTFESCGMSGGADTDYILDVTQSVVRSALELKADGIALIEQTALGTPSVLQRCHKTVRRLADFYNAGFLVFRLPGSEDQESATPAHCVFDLASSANGIGPLYGQPAPSAGASTPPVSTTGDVPQSTSLEELKRL
jgi:hypothetical protein